MNYLAPSILAADFSKLGDDINAAVAAGAPMIHLDVMDGMFVPNISFGVPIIESVRKITDAILDVHLMIEEPIRYLDSFCVAGADIITVHYEACEDVNATLSKVKSLGVKVGLSISPDTPVDVLKPFFDMIDMVLIMSVYPGFGGQKFIEASLEKVQAVREMENELEKEDLWIEVDGGIGEDNIIKVMQAGANVFVAGSSVFKGDIVANVKALNAKIQ